MTTYPNSSVYRSAPEQKTKAARPETMALIMFFLAVSIVGGIRVLARIHEWYPAMLAAMGDWTSSEWVGFFTALTAAVTGIASAVGLMFKMLITEIRINRTAQMQAALFGAKQALAESPLPSDKQEMEKLTADIAAKSANATAEIAATVARQAVTVTVPKVQT